MHQAGDTYGLDRSRGIITVPIEKGKDAVNSLEMDGFPIKSVREVYTRW